MVTWKPCGASAPDGCSGVSFAVPGYWSPAQLGLLLGIAQELSIPVLGFVDAAVASARREYPGRELILLEASLHAHVLYPNRTVCQSIAGGARGPARPGHRCAGAQLCAVLCQRLPAGGPFRSLARRSYRAVPVRPAGRLAGIPVAGVDSFAPRSATRGTSSRPSFAKPSWKPAWPNAASRCCSARAACCRPTGPSRCCCRRAWTDSPAWLDSLSALPGVEVFSLEPGAAARAATRRSVTAAAAEGLRLLTALPWDQAPAPEPAAQRAGRGRRTTDAPAVRFAGLPPDPVRALRHRH